MNKITKINSIWEVTHFCQVYQGEILKTESSDPVLLRHFNSGRIMCISSKGLPYLQEFKDIAGHPQREEEPGSQDGEVKQSPKYIGHGDEEDVRFNIANAIQNRAPIANRQFSIQVTAPEEERLEGEYVGGGLSDSEVGNNASGEDSPLSQAPSPTRPRSGFRFEPDESNDEDSLRSDDNNRYGLGQHTGHRRTNPDIDLDQIDNLMEQQDNDTARSNELEPSRQFHKEFSRPVFNTKPSVQVDLDEDFKVREERIKTYVGEREPGSPPIIRNTERNYWDDKEFIPTKDQTIGSLNHDLTKVTPEMSLRYFRRPSKALDTDKTMLDQLFSIQDTKPQPRKLTTEDDESIDDGKSSPTKIRADTEKLFAALKNPAHKSESSQFKESFKKVPFFSGSGQPGYGGLNQEATRQKAISAMNVGSLLPHREALLDAKNAIYFVPFQKTTSNTVTDQQTYKLIPKVSQRNLQLHFLDARYSLEDIIDRFCDQMDPDESGDIHQHLVLNKLFIPLDEGQLETEFTSIAFLERNSKSGLTVELVSDRERRNLLKLRSCIDPIRELADIFRLKLQTDPSEINGRLIQVRRLLSLLLCFLYDAEFDSAVDYSIIEMLGEPLKDRQVAFKDTGLLDLLMELAHFPIENNYYSIQSINKPLYIRKVLCLVYVNIKAGISENRPNELYASQWLDMLIDYSQQDTMNYLRVKETLTELIDNNEKILSSQIKEPTVRKFVEPLLESINDAKSVGIIRAMCTCYGKPIVKNQELVTTYLLGDKAKHRKLVSELKMKENRSIVISNPWISSGAKQVIELQDLKSKSENTDRGAYFKFYLSLLGLFTELSLGRNYNAINVLRDLFPLDIITEIICNKEYSYELRTVFCNLLEVLYIDVFPFQELTIPLPLRSIQTLDTNYLGGQYKKVLELGNFKRIIDFVFITLSFDNIIDYNEAVDFIKAILKLCDRMIYLGFFQELEIFMKIYAGLIRLMKVTFVDEGGIKSNLQKYGFKHNTGSLTARTLGVESSQTQEKTKNLRIAVCKLLHSLFKVEIDFCITKIVALYNTKNASQTGNIRPVETENEGLMLNSTQHPNTSAVGVRELFGNIVENIMQSTDKLIPKDPELALLLVESTMSSSNELKEFCLMLLEEMHSETKISIKGMLKVLVIESEYELNLKLETDSLRGELFKCHEKIPTWINKPTSNDYSKLNAILSKIQLFLKDNQQVSGMLVFGDDNKTSDGMIDLENKYTWVRIMTNSLMRRISHFYQNLLEATGALSLLIKIFNIVLMKMPEAPTGMLESNAAILNQLIFVLSEAAFENQVTKLVFLPFIVTWIQVSTKYTSKAGLIVKKSARTIFVSGKFDPRKDFNDLAAGKIEKVASSLLFEPERLLSPTKSSGNSRRGSISKRLEGGEQIERGDHPLFGNCLSIVVYTIMNFEVLLRDTKKVEEIARALISNLASANRKHCNYYLMAQHFYSLEKLLVLHEQFIKENQRIVIRMIVEKIKVGIFAYYSTFAIVSTIKQDIQQNVVGEEINGRVVYVMPPRSTATLAFFSLLTMCCIQHNEQSQKIAQNFITAHDVREILNIEKTPLIIMSEINKFLYTAYFWTDKVYALDTQLMLFDIAKSIGLQFSEILATIKLLTEVETFYLTSKELLSSSVLIKDYFKVTLQIFKVFLFTAINSSRSKSDFMMIYSFMSDLLVQCHNCIPSMKTAYIAEYLTDFIDSMKLKIAASELDLEELSPEARKLIQKDKPKSLLKSDTSMLRKLFQQYNEDMLVVTQQGQFLSGFLGASTQFNILNKNVKALGDVVRSTFSQISTKPYFRLACDQEFEQLIYHGEDPNRLQIFRGFLIGLTSYLNPKNNVETEMILTSLKILDRYISPSIAYQISGTLSIGKSNQTFLLKIGLDKLICQLICAAEDEDIIFGALETAKEFLTSINTSVQSSFIDSILLVDSFEFFKKITHPIKQYLPVIEQALRGSNSTNLMRVLLDQVSPNPEGLDKTVKLYIDRCILYFSFLKLLCQGHNSKAQNFLRLQVPADHPGASRRNFDMILGSLDILKVLAKCFNNDSLDLMIAAINFLIEVTLGACVENQKILIDALIVDCCKDILASIDKRHEDVLKTKGIFLADTGSVALVNILMERTITLAMALLEGEKNLELIESVGKIIDLEKMMARITQIYTEYFVFKVKFSLGVLSQTDSKEGLVFNIKSKQFDKKLREAFTIFFFIKTIDDSTHCYQTDIAELSDISKRAFGFFEVNSGHIEVMFKGSITKTYFIKHPACNYLPESSMEETISLVRHENENQKISAFLHFAPNLINLMEYSFDLRKKFHIKPEYLRVLRVLALVICYALNIYIFFLSKFKVVNGYFQDDDSKYDPVIVTVHGIIYIIVMMVLIVLFYLNTVRIKMLQKWSQYFSSIKHIKSVTAEQQVWLTERLSKGIYHFESQDYYELIEFKRHQEGASITTPALIKISLDLKFIDAQLWVLVFYSLCFFAGLITGEGWFYSFPLLDTLILMKAVTLNGSQILLAVVLEIFIIFVLTLYAYYFVIDTFWNGDFDGGENMCTSVRHCFFTILSLVVSSHSGSPGNRRHRQPDRSPIIRTW